MDRTSSSQIGTSIQLTRRILKDGGPTALYRGLSPNIIGNSVSWAFYFMCYGKVKDALIYLNRPNTTLSYYDYFLASGTAGEQTQPVIDQRVFYDRHSRSFNSSLYESNLGHQDSHAVHFFEAPARLHVYSRWSEADCSKGRLSRILPRSDPVSVWCFSWRLSIHGL